MINHTPNANMADCVCSLHFRPEDLRKSLNGRVYVREDAILSKFDWSGPSPKKRKAPTERKPLLTKKKLLNDDCLETEEIFLMETIKAQPSTSTDKASEEPAAAEIIITQQQFKELEEKLRKAENELNQLCHENSKFKE